MPPFSVFEPLVLFAKNVGRCDFAHRSYYTCVMIVDNWYDSYITVYCRTTDRARSGNHAWVGTIWACCRRIQRRTLVANLGYCCRSTCHSHSDIIGVGLFASQLVMVLLRFYSGLGIAHNHHIGHDTILTLLTDSSVHHRKNET